MYTNYLGPRLHAKFQAHLSSDSEVEDFKLFIPYVGIEAVLVL